MKTGFLLTGLIFLIVANILMVVSMKYMRPSREGFMSSYGANPASTGAKYQTVGKFDNVRLTPNNGVSAWRYISPNEPLERGAAEFQPGDDSLFIFKNNQCKPECCPSSFSCDGGGCVCTTPAQRQMIATRGGNRTPPDDGV
jgi:hypothetical protein